MSNEVKRFFSSINFETDFFNNAEVEKVLLNKNTDSFKVYLTIDNVLDKQKVDELLKCSSNGIESKECNVSIKYKIIEIEDIKKYIDLYFEELVKHRVSLCSIKEYELDIVDNAINIKIPVNMLKKELTILSANIKKYLKDYFLGKFDINLIINVEKKSLKETVKKNNNVEYKPSKDFVFGDLKKGKNINLKDIYGDSRNLIVEASIFDKEELELKGKRGTAYIVNAKVNDKTDSFIVKFVRFEEKEFLALSRGLKVGKWYRFYGHVELDDYSKQFIFNALGVEDIPSKDEKIVDNSEIKRVELHTHTMMSAMDSVVDANNLLNFVSSLGHRAVAVTDHNVLQSFPTLFNNKKYKNKDLKVIYGVEMNVIDADNKMVYNFENFEFKGQEFVVFDVETTGLNANKDFLIEIGAVKIKDGIITDRFNELISCDIKLPEIITKITNITDEMLKGKDSEEEVLKRFLKFIKDLPLVAHNAGFDKSFIEEASKRYNIELLKNTIIDTMSLSRVMYPEWSNHKLTTLARNLNIPWDEDQHHRADYDSEKTALAFYKMLEILKRENVEDLKALNNLVDYDNLVKFAHPFHVSILAKNKVGLKNLFKIVSIANTKYLFKGKDPKIPRGDITLLREGLLIGSGCINGELFQKAYNMDDDELRDLMVFYDYIEVYPSNVVSHLIGKDKQFKNLSEYHGYIKRIIKVAKDANKIVVATGDVHNLTKEDLIYREIIINQKTLGKLHPLNREGLQIPNQYFLTTDEMLEDFSYLDEELRNEIVITNTNLISDMIEDLEVIKSKLYTPKMSNSEKLVTDMVYENAKAMYGNNLPKIIKERLEQELEGIIKGGYDVIYLISQKLVEKSNNDGYFVGSRGSVGSSLVATMMNITEVNPLPPHYLCPNCKTSIFEIDGIKLEENYSTGYDMPDLECECKTMFKKEGHTLPFATFLGFKAEKVPDIDLNFSGDYQAIAHNYVKELFGETNAYRAGTISTVASKTAFGYVRGYLESKGLVLNQAEIERLALGCTGVKRTTGQHPGGIIVIPKEKDVFDFTPFQYPADEPDSSWYTTHFDFHAIEDNVLKLDILGHDDPTTIKYLEDTTKKDMLDITFDDKKVLSLFNSCEVLGIKEEDILCKTGTLGIPEFGTNFVIRMLQEVNPTKFSHLVKISGLSHGTNVWQNNVRDLIINDIATFDKVVGCRDDIMVSLISYGLPAEESFKISEFVRKGKPKKEPDKWQEMANLMHDYSVPYWFIEMLRKIEYMFPKAHATAYVMMAYRVAWFKLYYPLHYYSAYFSIRRSDFDVAPMLKGYEAIKRRVAEIKELKFKATPKEAAVGETLNVALEMLARGYKFKNISVQDSMAKTFVLDEEDKSLIIPFMAIEGLGESVAYNIEKEREQKEFYCVEDFATRSKINQTTLKKLEELGVFEGMDESAQMSLF